MLGPMPASSSIETVSGDSPNSTARDAPLSRPVRVEPAIDYDSPQAISTLLEAEGLAEMRTLTDFYLGNAALIRRALELDHPRLERHALGDLDAGPSRPLPRPTPAPPGTSRPSPASS